MDLGETGGIIFLSLTVSLVFGSLAIIIGKRWREAKASGGSLSSAQLQLSVMIVVLFAGAVAYKLLVWEKLEQTSALFIGLPTLLALIVVLSPKSKSITGMILRGITIALLMSGIVLGEGFICIIMSAPLFYLIGIIIGIFAELSRNKGQKINIIVALPLLLMSLEGTIPVLSHNRDEVVVAEKQIAASRDEIFTMLAQTPNFSTILPFYLKMGFPHPVSTEGSGLSIGDYRQIRFAGGEGKPGDLSLRVASVSKNRIVFEAVSDTSHIAHWLDWKTSIVEIQEQTNGDSLVRWSVEYDRRLDPAWYFGPWERYAVSLAAEYLIDNLATPRKSL